MMIGRTSDGGGPFGNPKPTKDRPAAYPPPCDMYSEPMAGQACAGELPLLGTDRRSMSKQKAADADTFCCFAEAMPRIPV